MQTAFLKKVLFSNAIFSSACALVLVAAPGKLAPLFGSIPNWIFIALGIGLLIFAIDVWWIAGKLPRSLARAKFIFYADVGWVLATPLVLITAGGALSFWGIVLLADIAIVVALLAMLEWIGIKRASRTFTPA